MSTSAAAAMSSSSLYGEKISNFNPKRFNDAVKESRRGESFQNDDLGRLVDNFQVPVGDNSTSNRNTFPDSRQLLCVSATIVSCLIISYVLIFVVNDAVMSSRHEGWRDNETRTETMVNLLKEEKAYPMAGTNPISKLSLQDFNLYIALFLFITTVESGLGLELLIWLSLLRHGWSFEFERIWRFAKLVFPLFVTIAACMSMHQEFAGLFFLVAGLWKLGFPETFLYFYSAMYNRGIDQDSRGLPARISDFFNGWGIALHHSSVTVFCTILLAGVTQPSPASLSCALPPLMQHWFVMLDYVAPTLYIVIVLSLEVWFEWTIFSVYHEVAMEHWCWPLCAIAMLVAHWMYLLAAGIDLVFRNKKMGEEIAILFDSENSSVHSPAVNLSDCNDCEDNTSSVTSAQEYTVALKVSDGEIQFVSPSSNRHINFLEYLVEDQKMRIEV